MAPERLPVLIVGDVHGDLERLFAALRPYPADQWHTVFVGDLVDYGMYGVGALRYARDRANTTVVIGNHEVAMLWALRDPARIGFWMSIGGQEHDLAELARDSNCSHGSVIHPRWCGCTTERWSSIAATTATHDGLIRPRATRSIPSSRARAIY